jgi:hypothetical protein
MQRVWVIIVCSSSSRPSRSSASPSPGLHCLSKTNTTSFALVAALLRDPVVAQLAVQVTVLPLPPLLPSPSVTSSPALALLLAADELALAFLLAVVEVRSVSAAVVLVAATGVLVFPLLVHFLFHLDLKNVKSIQTHSHM